MPNQTSASESTGMQSSLLPPVFAVPPPLPPPSSKRHGLSGWLIALIVLGVALFTIVAIGVVAAIAIPNIGALNDSAREAKERRKARAQQAVAPKMLPLSPQQKEMLEAFGEALAKAISDKDEEGLALMQDAEALMDSVLTGLAGFPDMAAAKRDLLAKTCAGPDGWLISLSEGDGQVKFLRARERQGHPTVLLRMKRGDGSVGYMDVMVRPDGPSFKAVDMFNHAFAINVSEELRRDLVMKMRNSSANMALAFGLPATDDIALTRLEVIYATFNLGKMEDVVGIFDRLPHLKTQKPFFLLRLLALVQLHDGGSAQFDKDYNNALEIAPAILGKDIVVGLPQAYLRGSEGNYQEAEECLKRVADVVGGDPYLKVMRGELRLLMEDFAGALALADQAVEEESTLTEAVDLRLSVHLARKDHPAVLKELRAFRQHSGIILDRKALADDEKYTEFLTTPEFVAWEKETALKP